MREGSVEVHTVTRDKRTRFDVKFDIPDHVPAYSLHGGDFIWRGVSSEDDTSVFVGAKKT